MSGHLRFRHFVCVARKAFVYHTYVMTVGDVMCGIDCVACLVTVSLGLSSAFSFVLCR